MTRGDVRCLTGGPNRVSGDGGTVAHAGTVEGIESADTELPYATIAAGLSQLPKKLDLFEDRFDQQGHHCPVPTFGNNSTPADRGRGTRPRRPGSCHPQAT
jgi:hypothetical protein